MHTAGLSYGDGDSALDTLYDAAGCGWDAPYKLPLDEFVRRLATLPLAFQPCLLYTSPSPRDGLLS
eukprot:2038284-Pleurochrysis_carterae.AAC.1